MATPHAGDSPTWAPALTRGFPSWATLADTLCRVGKDVSARASWAPVRMDRDISSV